MPKCFKPVQSSLIPQIDSIKNYLEHRYRVESAKQQSPVDKSRKSISFDPTLRRRDAQTKLWRIRSKNFRQEHIRAMNQSHDSLMLSKIKQYEDKKNSQRQRVTSPNNSLLHHNATIIRRKMAKDISGQNQKLFYRISSMRSNYDQKQINKSRINKYVLNTTPNFKMTPSISSQTRTENAESPMKDNLAKVKLKLQKCSTEETMPRWNQKMLPTTNRNLSFKIPVKAKTVSTEYNSSQSRQLCDRLRLQKVALLLYEKKLKTQAHIPHRFIKKYE